MTLQLRAATLISVTAITSLMLGGCGSTAGQAPPAPVTSSQATSSQATSSQAAPSQAAPTRTAPTQPAPTRATSTPAVPAQDQGLPVGYMPLYPFASLADVHAWQASYASGGHQPWHLSPGDTALAFAAYLGYTDVTQVARTTVSGTDARVTVGIKLPDGSTGTAAVVHLIRFGSDAEAPWEVVGTDDTTLTLEHPAYGSTASSPVTAGGTITGVDESIKLTVYSLSATGPVGTYCCLAAGGMNTPWSGRVTFHAAPGQVVTIAAATGGHVATVERFAVTGIRVP